MNTTKKINGVDGFSDDNNNLCRVCLSANDDNKCIFTFHPNDQSRTREFNEIFEKLVFYGGIKVSQNDGLPGRMCDGCISDLYAAHEFRTRCQASDKILRASVSVGAVADDRRCSSASRTEPLQDLRKKESRNVYSDEFPKLAAENIRDVHCVSKNSEHEISFGPNETTIPLKNVMESESRKIASPGNFDSDNGKNSTVVAIRDPVDKSNLEKSISKKDDYRSRRIALFKKATSMTNLRNNKEIQRKHMKKTRPSAVDGADVDRIHREKKNSNGPSGPNDSDRDRCYSCETVSDTFRNVDENVRIPRVLRDNRSDRLERVRTNDEAIRNPMKKLEPAKCDICKKNFRKSVTMIRHLNVHKRDNPRAVYAILKDIRDVATTKGQKFKTIGEPNTEIFDDSSRKKDNNSRFENKNRRTKEFVRKASYQSRENRDRDDDRSTIKLINTWIKEHLESDVNGKKFSCDDCDKFYATKKSLLNHRTKIHGNDSAKKCPRCNESRCFCNEPTIVPSNKDPSKKIYSCNDCEKTFDKETKLDKHAKIHEREKNRKNDEFKRFLCDICSKTFRQNTGLVFHMRTHTGYKPHVCKYCGRGFTSNSNCVNHERTHTGDRPFVCHFCSAAFAKSCTLKAHITTHTGEANYHCKTCGKSFRRLKYLKEHRFTHTGEKPYACKICGTAYSHSGSLFVHEKKCKSQEVTKNSRSSITESDSFVPLSVNQRNPLGATIVGDSPIASMMKTTSTICSHHRHVGAIDDSSNIAGTRNYIETASAINDGFVNCPSDIEAAHCQSVTNLRNFTVIGPMFHT